MANLYPPEWTEKTKSLFPLPDFDDLFGFSPLHKAIIGLEGYRIDALIKDDSTSIDAKDSDGRTPLSWATTIGNAKAMRTLLEAGADCNRAAMNRRSPLMCAARKGSPYVDLLLKAGADVSAKNAYQATALHLAAEADMKRQPLEIAKSLVKAGVEIDTQAHDGTTALFSALYQHNQDVANYLIDCGADIAIRDLSGHSVLSTAILYNTH